MSRQREKAECKIVPEYTIDYYQVVNDQLTKLLPEERDELGQAVNENFYFGMLEYQQLASINWLNSVLVENRMTQEKAAGRLKIERTRLNRWLNGTANPSFDQIQNFYVHLAGRHPDDHPFQERDRLHLGGYLRAVKFMRSWLEECKLVRNDAENMPSPTRELFLMLYYFFALLGPVEAFDEDADIDQDVRKIMGKIAECISEEERMCKTIPEFLRAVSHWGLAWLYCLTLIAEAEMGVSIDDNRITTTRAVLIK